MKMLDCFTHRIPHFPRDAINNKAWNVSRIGQIIIVMIIARARSMRGKETRNVRGAPPPPAKNSRLSDEFVLSSLRTVSRYEKKIAEFESLRLFSTHSQNVRTNENSLLVSQRQKTCSWWISLLNLPENEEIKRRDLNETWKLSIRGISYPWRNWRCSWTFRYAQF